MKTKALILLCFSMSVLCQNYPCSLRSTMLTLKRPTYEFSLQILDKVAQETEWHFVYSPLSTWLQLLALAEGAQGRTLNEIWSVTKHHRILCFRRKLRQILNNVDKELKTASQRRSVIAVDKLLSVKDSFTTEVEKLNSVKVLLLDFNDPERAAATVNELIEADTNGVIKEAVSPEDFPLSVLLMTDAAYFKSTWRNPFNAVYTSPKPFYSEDGVAIGNVNMMYQMGYFNVSTIPRINAQVLELPCNVHDRVSMFVFLPTAGTVKDLFVTLKEIRLMTIFNIFKFEREKLVNVYLPRFKINTDIDSIPELVYDMGLKSIFYSNIANFKGISDYKIYASLMTQIADIEITERGITAGVVAELLVNNADKESQDFKADKPFVFMLVDKRTEIILFSGIYSTPSVY